MGRVRIPSNTCQYISDLLVILVFLIYFLYNGKLHIKIYIIKNIKNYPCIARDISWYKIIYKRI